MATEYLPEADFLRECFDYDQLTGAIIWKSRPPEHFTNPTTYRSWNTRYAGKPAFKTPDTNGYLKAELLHYGTRLRLVAHRVIFKLVYDEDPQVVTHMNGDKADNRLKNLRGQTIGQLRKRFKRRR